MKETFTKLTNEQLKKITGGTQSVIQTLNDDQEGNRGSGRP